MFPNVNGGYPSHLKRGCSYQMEANCITPIIEQKIYNCVIACTPTWTSSVELKRALISGETAKEGDERASEKSTALVHIAGITVFFGLAKVLSDKTRNVAIRYLTMSSGSKYYVATIE